MGSNNLLITFTLIFIFSISLINFAAFYAYEQDAPISIGDDNNTINYMSESQGQMNNFAVVVNGSSESFAESSISETSQSGTLVTGSPFKAPPKSPLSSLNSLLFLSYKTIFGGDSNFGIIYGTIIALISMMVIFAAWKLWKGGDPD